MLKTRTSTFLQNASNRKGQVALFIALAFQILFVFFAMIINVGLLVHHKINLQNSVDLAAYYGAAKQAENMNAIAHMNYQIRQSWKLLAWRYRMLGTAGDFIAHPYRKENSPNGARLNVNGWAVEDYHPVGNANYIAWQKTPAFCIAYTPFKGGNSVPGENTCKDVSINGFVPLWRAPPIIAGFQSFSHTIRAQSENLRINATNRCKIMGSLNYVMLGKFIVSFNMDQRDRMEMIAALSRGTSAAKDEFFDIDGNSVKEGVKKTLLNNLTSANRASLQTERTGGFDFYNSLGVEGCNNEGLADGQPAKWLNAVRIAPGFAYIDTICDGQTVRPTPKVIPDQGLPHHLTDSVNPYTSQANALKDFIQINRASFHDNYNYSIGVEKNPWCMSYVGVSAATKPKIPFSPFGTVTLKARAFYKPFGGRIGPWYFKKWPRSGGELGSEGNNFDGQNRTDPNLPPRYKGFSFLDTAATDEAVKEHRMPNYSRYVGDPLGLKSLKMMGYYGEAIFELDGTWRNSTAGASAAASDAGASPYVNNAAPSYDHWDEIPFDFNDSNRGSGDPLAWDLVNNRPSAMRVLETAGILPDLFDMTYYSIEPDFYNNYYLRIKNGYLPKRGQGNIRMFRPDLGYRRGGGKNNDIDYEKFSVKDQFKVVNDPNDVVKIIDAIKQHFTYVSTDWAHALTSWSPKSLLDYSLNTEMFGKCLEKPIGSDNEPNPPTPGHCVVGGTTGYAVKMISSDYLRSELELGGDGVKGTILNQPPPDSEF